MISSMTGFAAAAREMPQGSLAVELKTVNHRYLEFQTRIPEEIRPLEPAMREAVGGAPHARQGRLPGHVHAGAPPRSARSCRTPPRSPRCAMRRQRVLERFPDARPLSVAEILHWPGVLAETTLSPKRVKDA